MKPFEEALFDAVLEEYAVLPCNSATAAQQHSPTQRKNRTYTSHRRNEIAHRSLWLAKDEKSIFLQPVPGAGQYDFRTQKRRDMFLGFLLQNGFVLKEQGS